MGRGVSRGFLTMEKLDPGDNQNSEQERILEILDYWHKIEFFVPFDLEKMIDDSLGWQVIWLHKDDLKNEASAFWNAIGYPEITS
jgi:hypothetical protein